MEIPYGSLWFSLVAVFPSFTGIAEFQYSIHKSSAFAKSSIVIPISPGSAEFWSFDLKFSGGQKYVKIIATENTTDLPQR